MKTEIGCNHGRGGHIIHSNTCNEVRPVNKKTPPIEIKKQITIETPATPLKSAGT